MNPVSEIQVFSHLVALFCICRILHFFCIFYFSPKMLFWQAYIRHFPAISGAINYKTLYIILGTSYSVVYFHALLCLSIFLVEHSLPLVYQEQPRFKPYWNMGLSHFHFSRFSTAPILLSRHNERAWYFFFFFFGSCLIPHIIYAYAFSSTP